MTDPRPAPTEPAPAASDAVSKPNAWARLAENPLPAILGAVIVVLLGYNLTVTNDRISDANVRISRLEDKMDARFAAQEAMIDALDDKIDEKFGELDAKIDEKFGELDAKIDALDDKVDEKFGELDAKIDALDDKVDEMIGELDDKIGALDLKLTALIVALETSGTIDGITEIQTTATQPAGYAPNAVTGSTDSPSERPQP